MRRGKSSKSSDSSERVKEDNPAAGENVSGLGAPKQKKEKQQKKARQQDEIDWAFDCKDAGYGQGEADKPAQQKKQEEFLAKFGNFNTPIIMKLCSKYNKKIQSERMRADPSAICAKVIEYLNQMLASEDDDVLMKKLKIR